MKLQPPSCLILGPSGAGKTSVLATQLLSGLEVFVLMTEPGGVESLLDSCERLKAPIDKLHWTSCLPASQGWAGIEDMITKINSYDQKQLADVKDMGKADFRPAAMTFLNALKNFPCERTGQSFGDVTTWDDTRSLNIDSLSGWSVIAWGTTVGYKPTANPGEWGIAQNFINNMLLKLSNDRKCYFNLTAHIERELDDMTGARRIMVSTIGAKLAPKVPKFFSEVVLASRRMDSNGNAEFRWATVDNSADLKNRALPVSAILPPDFRPVIDAYLRRKKLAATSPSPAASLSPQPAVVSEAPKVQGAPMTPKSADGTIVQPR